MTYQSYLLILRFDSGGVSSPPATSSQPLSLTETMQQVNEIIDDGQIDSLSRIERLEAVLTAATSVLTPSSDKYVDCHVE